ncbi:MAG TPA: MFS transporter [Gammaproteobacteria bacterium]|nr:MFS transporter [Gammaproteobacteria bacterium]
MSANDNPRRRTIILLALAGFTSMASVRVGDGLLPELIRAFGRPTSETAYVITAFAIGYGAMQLVFGPLGDRYGKYRIIGIATLACGAWSLATAFAPTLAWLIVLRAVTGGTTAAIIPLGLAWIGDTTPYSKRQPVIARMVSGVILGVGGGQLLGGGLADTLGWRWAFAVLGAFYVCVGLFMQADLRHDGASSARPSPAGASLGVVSRIHLVLRTPWARRVLGTVFVEGILVFGTLALIPYYLNHYFAVSLTVAGATVALFALGGFLYTTQAQRLVPALGETGLSLAGSAIAGLSLLMLGLGPTWVWAAPASFGLGLGYYFLHNTLQTNATQMVPDHRGTAVSVFAAALFMGQSAGVSASAALIHTLGPGILFTAAAVCVLMLGLSFASGLRGQGR